MSSEREAVRDMPVLPDRMGWRTRLVPYLVGALAGTDEQKETAIEVVMASIEQAYHEGIWDAADVAVRCARVANSRELMITANSLIDLYERNAGSRPLPHDKEVEGK